ncbi:MAG: diacylglycerol kinase family lipid kinase [Actinomycetota bacterium]|nr:MAG: diacylglycerol kinase family lipid kinase [Actinomycetota bacterium]
MRGLLVVNPNATTTTARVRDVMVHALADEIDLDVVTTDRRGHAVELARQARADRWDVVVTLGGDGTVNEVVNGLLAAGPGPDVPLLATVPGGSANVFARALGLPADPVEATGAILDGLREKRFRTVGLGQADSRWFTFNAGLGLDAEIVAAVERKRAAGTRATPRSYLASTVRQFFVGTDRREPALTLHRPGVDPVTGVFLAIVQNTSPWTFIGPMPVDPCPRASFDTGLDLFGVRRLSLLSGVRYGRRILTSSRAGQTRGLVTWHDQSGFEVSASRPVQLQVDGDALGEVDRVAFRAVPAALRAVV